MYTKSTIMYIGKTVTTGSTALFLPAPTSLCLFVFIFCKLSRTHNPPNP